MQRRAELHSLSEHHHHVLVLALEIRRAAEGPAVTREAKLRELAERFLEFWEQNGRTHFAEEEQVLLPKYARHIRLDEDADVMRMLADHAAIRAQIEELKERRGARCVPQTLIELGRALHDHVRLEEDRIFPRLEKALSEAELSAVGVGLTRLHGEKPQ